MKAQHPIFFDPSARRARLLKFVAGLAFCIAAFWSVLLVAYYFSPHALPAVSLPEPAAVPVAERSVAGTSETPSGYVPLPAAPAEAPPTHRGPASHLAFAFMINWDQPALDSLERHLSDLDAVIPQWLYYNLDNRMLIEDDPGSREAVVSLLAEARRRQLEAPRVMPMVTNLLRGQWQGDRFAALLAEPAARREMVDQLVDYARVHDFNGISVDLEMLPDVALPDYYLFLEELGPKLHGHGLQLSVSVPFESEPLDYPRVARAVDYLIPMGYDQHWAGGSPGPVAGAAWIGARAAYFRQNVPAEKLILAVGNYALDWSRTNPGVHAAPLTVEAALARAGDAGVPVTTDPGSLNPYFRYRSPEGEDREVWLLDAVTTYNAMTAFAAARPAGFALWRLGMEDPSVWQILARDRHVSPASAARLATITPEQVHYRGAGEILRFASAPRDGSRALALAPATGLVHQTYTAVPAAYAVKRFGQADKQLALTFDDGPSPVYTPQILALLRELNVQGSFFVVGTHVQEHPGLVREAFAGGHDIGVHTFTHPDISRITPAQFDEELSLSQRAIEAAIGRRSILFRPPFGRDINPSRPDHIRPLQLVADRGYLTVGMRVDTADWTNPGEESIVEAAVDQVAAGGRIIVMHDGGGDRSQTVRALPRLVAALRAKGYEFVTVTRLLHLSPDQTMPPIPPADRAEAAAARAASITLGGAVRFIQVVFFTGIILGFARMALIAAGALVHHRRRHRGELPLPDLTLAVIVPAYNESKVVAKTVRSLLASRGVPPFDILVIDDGSTDDTFARIRAGFADEPRVRIFTKPNGGKSSALNFGLTHTRADVVVMLDADTLFQADTLRRLVARFSDPAVGAVAGNVKVGNRLNMLTRWQALEYITSQSLDRRALTTINCNNVVPGAIGAWRRALVVEVGMYGHQTLAEDADLTLSVCRLGYKIEYEPLAVAHTEAPDTLKAFLKQRFRWGFGTLQVAAKHLPALFNRRHAWLGFVGIPNMLLFQVVFPLLAPFMDLVILASVGTMAYSQVSDVPVETLAARQFIGYYLLFLTADAASATLAFVLERNEDARLLLWVPFQRVFYRFVMYYVGLKSVAAAVSGKAVGWGSLQRKATVSVPCEEPAEELLVEA
jgi:cellulose synthase/poly-beta-1,6-N-acetylglucosamine synthase-like glycosyltransferase/peptidoglycan/xylan/chitin deacetylase (PgdA/CDA1 family)/spore germination protein YaaH